MLVQYRFRHDCRGKGGVRVRRSSSSCWRPFQLWHLGASPSSVSAICPQVTAEGQFTDPSELRYLESVTVWKSRTWEAARLLKTILYADCAIERRALDVGDISGSHLKERLRQLQKLNGADE